MKDELVSVAIRQMAESYGGRKELDPEVLSECIDLVIENFGGIGATEIRTAYQLWSMRIINGMEMWGGEMNAAQLGRVLSDYVRYRKTVVNELINKRHEMEEEQAKKRRAEYFNQRTIETFPEALAAAKKQHEENTGFETWDKVLGNWYDLAEDQGLLSITNKEKRPYWDQAKKLARTDVSAQIAQLLSSKRTAEARAYRNEYKEDGEAFKRKRVAISKKLIVFEKLIK